MHAQANKVTHITAVSWISRGSSTLKIGIDSRPWQKKKQKLKGSEQAYQIKPELQTTHNRVSGLQRNKKVMCKGTVTSSGYGGSADKQP